MSIGVTYDQFWNVGSDQFKICRYAREAECLRIKRQNEEQWWFSIYLRRTLLDVSPAFRDFHKGNKVEIECSTKEPMPMTEEEIEERKKRDEERKMNDYINQLLEFGMRHNAELRKKKETKEETPKGEKQELHVVKTSGGYEQLSFFNEESEVK